MANIKYFESMSFNYIVLVAVGAGFTLVHAMLGMWIWVCIGLGITLASMYVAICAAMEMDAQIEITKAIEKAKQEKVDALYNRRSK